jgi:hypothetical protein
MVAARRREAGNTARVRREKRQAASTRRLPVNVQCPPHTGGVERSVLVASTRRTLTPDEARARVIRAVEAAVSEVCRWGALGEDWTVGDYRFLIFEFWPAKGDCLYVQLWTEPDEPVVVEACSGAWAPPARKYIHAPQRAAFRAVGYEVGGRARNFQKQWNVTSQRDACALARELVDILVDVFGYRGRQPLVMKSYAEGRSHREPVFDGLVIEDMTRMLAIAGITATALTPQPLAAPGGEPDSSAVTNPDGPKRQAVTPRELKRRLLKVDKPFTFIIEMVLKAKPVPPTYNGIRLLSVLDDGAGLSDADIVTLNNLMPCGRIERDPLGQVVFALELWLRGITVGWFVSMMATWTRLRKQAAKLVARAHRGRRADVVPDADADDSAVDALDVDERPAYRSRTVVH